MNWLKRIFARRRLYDDLSAEIQEHIEEKTEELIAAGMTREEAAAAARREFGNVSLVEQRGREEWRWPALESIAADFKYALRMFARRPAFTLVAVLALGIGIGSNTAIFSLANAVLLHGLPVENPERLVVGWQQDLSSGRDRITFSPAEYTDYQGATRSFNSMAAVQPVSLNMTLGNEPVAVEGARCSLHLLSTLGIKPFLGRGFIEDEDSPHRNRVAMLSHAFFSS